MKMINILIYSCDFFHKDCEIFHICLYVHMSIYSYVIVIFFTIFVKFLIYENDNYSHFHMWIFSQTLWSFSHMFICSYEHIFIWDCDFFHKDCEIFHTGACDFFHILCDFFHIFSYCLQMKLINIIIYICENFTIFVNFFTIIDNENQLHLWNFEQWKWNVRMWKTAQWKQNVKMWKISHMNSCSYVHMIMKLIYICEEFHNENKM